jgi:hypothetical protein
MALSKTNFLEIAMKYAVTNFVNRINLPSDGWTTITDVNYDVDTGRIIVLGNRTSDGAQIERTLIDKENYEFDLISAIGNIKSSGRRKGQKKRH